MLLEDYGMNVKNYVDILPKTNVVVVYFKYFKKKAHAHIVEDIHIFNKHTLIRTSEKGIWTMIYSYHSLRCFIARVDSDVKYASTNKSWIESFEELSGGMECQLRNHLTLGIEKYGNMFMLNTHTTTYSEKPEEYGTFVIDHPIECRVPLLMSLSPDTMCYTKKAIVTKERFVDMYKTEQHLVKTIEILKNVCTGEIKVASGPRGGTYIQKDGLKKYVKQVQYQQHGGVSQDQQEIIDMIYDRIVRHVMEVYEKNTFFGMDASMIYDTVNYFEVQRPVLVLMYESEEAEKCAVFHLDLEQVQLALLYEKQSVRDRQAKGKKWRSWKEFQKQRDIHIRAVLAM